MWTAIDGCRECQQKATMHGIFESCCNAVVIISFTCYTLGAKGFSCAVSVFGQVLKSDLRETPLG